jgi:hypothetical protein
LEKASETSNVFLAYSLLFTSFNNYYSLLADFKGSNPAKIGKAIKTYLSEDSIKDFYTYYYECLIRELTSHTPFELRNTEDSQRKGILNLEKFFQGQSIDECICNLEESEVASHTDSVQSKKETLIMIATQLLWTIRNNQFHAIKDGRRDDDLRVLEWSYKILCPIVTSLKKAAERLHPNSWQHT